MALQDLSPQELEVVKQSLLAPPPIQYASEEPPVPTELLALAEAGVLGQRGRYIVAKNRIEEARREKEAEEQGIRNLLGTSGGESELTDRMNQIALKNPRFLGSPIAQRLLSQAEQRQTDSLVQAAINQYANAPDAASRQRFETQLSQAQPKVFADPRFQNFRNVKEKAGLREERSRLLPELQASMGGEGYESKLVEAASKSPDVLFDPQFQKTLEMTRSAKDKQRQQAVIAQLTPFLGDREKLAEQISALSPTDSEILASPQVKSFIEAGQTAAMNRTAQSVMTRLAPVLGDSLKLNEQLASLTGAERESLDLPQVKSFLDIGQRASKDKAIQSAIIEVSPFVSDKAAFNKKMVEFSQKRPEVLRDPAFQQYIASAVGASKEDKASKFVGELKSIGDRTKRSRALAEMAIADPEVIGSAAVKSFLETEGAADIEERKSALIQQLSPYTGYEKDYDAAQRQALLSDPEAYRTPEVQALVSRTDRAREEAKAKNLKDEEKSIAVEMSRQIDKLDWRSPDFMDKVKQIRASDPYTFSLSVVQNALATPMAELENARKIRLEKQEDTEAATIAQLSPDELEAVKREPISKQARLLIEKRETEQGAKEEVLGQLPDFLRNRLESKPLPQIKAAKSLYTKSLPVLLQDISLERQQQAIQLAEQYLKARAAEEGVEIPRNQIPESQATKEELLSIVYGDSTNKDISDATIQDFVKAKDKITGKIDEQLVDKAIEEMK